MARLVLKDRGVLAARHRRLQVQQDPFGLVRAVDDPANGVPIGTPRGAGGATDRFDVDHDPDAEVDFAHPHQSTKPFEFQVRVAFGIADDHDSAAPAYQFVGRQVLEVSAVGDHQEL